MGWQEINLSKYVADIKKHMNLNLSDELISKDLLLTLILAEFEKHKGVFNELIFKGGTLLSRNYLKYHRFSEDLDFVHRDSGEFRKLTRSARERKIKNFIDLFVPKLKEVADSLDLDFSIDRSNQKYCTLISGRVVYSFRVYYSEKQYIKIEINFVEKMINKPEEISVRAITDFFNSEKMMFDLNLTYDNFKVLSYPIEEIILEKYRAILTRKKLQERDLFDLFLIESSLDVDINEIVEKIRNSSLIKKDLNSLIQEKLKLLEGNIFFRKDERIEELAILEYNKKEFESFKEKLTPILIEICKKFLRE